MDKIKKISNLVSVSIFLLMLTVPLVTGIVEKDILVSQYEKRILTVLPEIPSSSLELMNYSSKFEKYYEDNFGFRQWMTSMFSSIKLSLGDSSVRHVTVGKEGWLFIGGIRHGFNGFHDAMGDYMNINRYSESELNRAVKYYSSVKKWLGKHGIEYLLVIAPNKHTIYPEYLPSYIKKQHKESAMDQILNALHSSTTVNFVDLRPSLFKAKKDGLVYFPNDTHWNQRAANVVQYEIMSKIKTLFPGISYPKMYEIEDKKDVLPPGGLLKMLGLDKNKGTSPFAVFDDSTKETLAEISYRKKRHVLINNKNKGIKAVVFRNSMFSAVKPFLYESFNKLISIWEVFNIKSMRKELNIDPPNIVIEQISERQLPVVGNQIGLFEKGMILSRFNSPKATLFENEWDQLQIIQQLKSKSLNSIGFELKSTGRDPILHFPKLPFLPGEQYLVNIKIISEVNSVLQLFYSTLSPKEHPFSRDRSHIKNVKKGRNDFYILLESKDLGQYLRLDPIITTGDFILESLVIKHVEK